MVRTKLNSASPATSCNSVPDKQLYQTPSPKKRPSSEIGNIGDCSTPVAKIRNQEKVSPPKSSQAEKRNCIAAPAEEGERMVAEFDAKKEIWDFLYNAKMPLAFRVAARYAAATPKRERLLRCHVAFSAVPSIRITFRGDTPKVFTEQVALWSLVQMRSFVQEFNQSLTSSGRRGKPFLTSNAIVARCPSLWWSLVLWTLGCRLHLREEETTWSLRAPAAVPVDMDDVIEALLAASDPGVTHSAALKTMQEIDAQPQ